MGWLRNIGSWVATGAAPAVMMTSAPVKIAAAAAAADSAKPAAAAARKTARSRAGTVISAGAIQTLDHNTEVRGPKWYGTPGKLGIAQKMMRDPYVRSALDTVIGPLVSAKWRFKPASKRPIDREAAEFCQWAFIDSMPWDMTLRELVRGYAANGFHLLEMTDDIVDLPAERFPLHPGGGRAVVPTAFVEIPAWTVDRWHQSPTNSRQISGIKQFVAGSDVEASGYVDVPADRIVRFTYDQEGADFTGLAMFRSAYPAWKLKIAFQTIDAIKHERTGVGTPSITLAPDADPEDIAAAEAILADMRVNAKGYIVLPSGYTFKWEGSTANDGTNLNEAIERCNKDIFVNFLSGFMLLGLSGRAGPYGLGSTQQGALHLFVDGQSRFVRTPLTIGVDGWSPVKRIVELNYGKDAGIPTLEARNLPTRNWADVVKAVGTGVQQGIITMDDATEAAVRDMLELDPLDEDTARETQKVALTPGPAEGQPDDGNDNQDGGSEPAPGEEKQAA